MCHQQIHRGLREMRLVPSFSLASDSLKDGIRGERSFLYCHQFSHTPTAFFPCFFNVFLVHTFVGRDA